MEGLETIDLTPPSCYALVNCTTGQVDYILNGTANGVDLASYLNQFVGRIESPTGTIYGCWSIQTSIGCEGFRSDIGVYDIVASGDLTNYCGCPDDYYPMGNMGNGECWKNDNQPAVFNNNAPTIANTGDTDHGLYGTVFFPIGNITTTPLPIGDITAGSYGTPPIAGVFKNGNNVMLPAPTNISRPLVGPYPFWGPLVGRLDDVGVWVNPSFTACNEWIGFSVCIPVGSVPSTFCIGMAGIDQVRCRINGKVVVLIDQTDYTYKTWNVFELNINNSLEYVIEFEAKQINCGPVATPALGAEIYGTDLATLQSINDQLTLDSYTVFTTKSYRTSGYFDIGETIGYTCPPGYFYNKCEGAPTCVFTDVLPRLNCCYQLLRCSDSTVEAQFTFNGNTPWPGVPFPTSIGNQAITSITLSNGTVMQGCWYLFKTPAEECNLAITPIYDWVDMLNYPYIQAITLVTDCTVCNPTIYVLKDCKTGFPYELDDGSILYLSLIAGACSSGTCPNDIGDEIITSIVNQSIPEITGCYTLTSVNVPLDTINPFPYEQIMQTVTTVATCEICYPTCYKLTNCVDPTIVIYTQNDLSNYIGFTITLAGYSSICWVVEVSDTCPDPVSIPNITSSTPYSGTVPLTKCCYMFPKEGIGGTAIEIDGILYTNPDPITVNIVDYINSLGVGVCTIEQLTFPERICITNNTNTPHTYGPITYKPSGIYQFIPSSCEVIIKSCAYEPYDFSQEPSPIWINSTISITINGVDYTSSAFNITGVGDIINYLNTLNQGAFGFTCDPMTVSTCTIYVSENYTFSSITITLENSTEIVIALDNCEGPTIECQECIDNLPNPPDPPDPPTPVFELHPRSVKPGYNTPACDPVYTEKVLCNYAEQAFDEMAKARYGIKICCEHDFDYWDLKKQILELKALYDESLCQVQFPCKCYSISNLNPTVSTEFKYSDCNGKYLTTTITNADGIVKVCATNLPIGTGGTPIVELNGLCPNEICP